MKFHLLILTIFLFFGGVLWACNDEKNFGGKCPPVDPYFKIESIRSYNLKVVGSGNNPWTGIPEGDQVYWWNFFIRFAFDSEYLALEGFGPNSNLKALSCLPAGYKGDKVGVDTLYLKTLSDFSMDYAAGDTLNSIMLMQDWTFSRDNFEEFFSIGTYLKENGAGINREVFEMKMTEGPAKAGEYTFELIYVLNNGDVFRHTTAPVLLRN
ncbi:hypothetical protein [Echinicola rosea]|nr:hypothetical protein [Echinicola rosea]